MCRYNSSGALDYLGRIDHQVKIRGFRIELGEIESVILHHPQIKECVVVAKNRAHNSDDKILVAYIILSSNASPNITEMRQHIKEKLPEFMVPSSFVALDKLPLNPNGKVDRKALPEPSQMQTEFDVDYAPPITDGQKKLVEIWKQVLGLERVGINDDFFELGGDSILAIQLTSKINQSTKNETSSKIAVKHLFLHPTIHSLSLYIQSNIEQLYPQSSIDQPLENEIYQLGLSQFLFLRNEHQNSSLLVELKHPSLFTGYKTIPLCFPKRLEEMFQAIVQHYLIFQLKIWPSDTNNPKHFQTIERERAINFIPFHFIQVKLNSSRIESFLNNEISKIVSDSIQANSNGFLKVY